MNRKRTFVISSPARPELFMVRGSEFLTDSLADCVDMRLLRWSCLCFLTVSAACSINNPRDTSSVFVCTRQQFDCFTRNYTELRIQECLKSHAHTSCFLEISPKVTKLYTCYRQKGQTDSIEQTVLQMVAQ